MPHSQTEVPVSSETGANPFDCSPRPAVPSQQVEKLAYRQGYLGGARLAEKLSLAAIGESPIRRLEELRQAAQLAYKQAEHLTLNPYAAHQPVDRGQLNAEARGVRDGVTAACAVWLLSMAREPGICSGRELLTRWMTELKVWSADLNCTQERPPIPR
jgi:hypothetical protein